MDSTENVPARIQAEARAKALAILNSEPGCISYVRPEDLETAALFIPVVSIIKPTKDDFYPPIPGIGIMAKPMLVNLICEKAGIRILRTETSKRGEYVYVAHCFGEKQMPDGAMEPKDASYEYDAEKRAELDAINQPEKYGTDIAKRKHLLETAKFGEQRAVTGAQHALIHKIAKCARSFKTPEELMRGMKVIRYDRNINGVLADPGLRSAALDRMLGATETVYGPKQIDAQPVQRTVDAESGEVLPTGTRPEEGQEALFPEAEPEKPPEPDPNPLESLKVILASYKRKIPADAKANKGTPIHAILDAAIADPKATEKTINTLIDNCEHYIATMKGGAA